MGRKGCYCKQPNRNSFTVKWKSSRKTFFFLSHIKNSLWHTYCSSYTAPLTLPPKESQTPPISSWRTLTYQTPSHVTGSMTSPPLYQRSPVLAHTLLSWQQEGWKGFGAEREFLFSSSCWEEARSNRNNFLSPYRHSTSLCPLISWLVLYRGKRIRIL